MSRRMLTATLVLVLALAFTGTALAEHAWGPYHWARTASPFTLKLGDNVTRTWDGHLSVASSDWTRSTVLNTTIVAGGTRPRTCKATSGRVEVCNASYGNNGWLGIAGISIVNGQHITQGYVKLNDYYWNNFAYDERDRALVTCQEIGHTLGLGHQDENFNNAPLGTCMDYSANPGPADEHPNAHDYAQLETIYSHLDSTTTVKRLEQAIRKMPPAMRDIEFDGIGQWGKLVDVTDDGRRSTFELDFGNGYKVITHVFWAFDVRGDHGDEH